MSKNSKILQIDLAKSEVVAEFDDLNQIIKTYVSSLFFGKNIETIRGFINSSLRGVRSTAYGYRWVYVDQIPNIALYLNEHKPQNLLVDLYPQLVLEWDYESNKGIDINTITYGVERKVSWKCLKDPEHGNYLCTVNNKTNNNRGCPKCGVNNIRIHDAKEKEVHILNREAGNVGPNKTEIGDATELYITNLLKEESKFPEVIKVGEHSNCADVVVTLDNGLRKSIQVKTLFLKIDSRYINCYDAHIGIKYDDNLLIVMVNKERNRFVLDYSKNLKVDKTCFPFNSKRSKYKDIMYTDKNLFLQKLIELIPLSIDYVEETESDTINKEYQSLKRFENWCLKNKIKYQPRDTNKNSVDAYIEDVHIQLKFCSFAPNAIYSVAFTKGGGYLNGKSIKAPYSVKDKFEYLVIEVGGTREEPEKYLGNFCFIPRSYLLNNNYFTKDNIIGKYRITIGAPDNTSHELHKYWKPLMMNNLQRVNFLLNLRAINHKLATQKLQELNLEK